MSFRKTALVLAAGLVSLALSSMVIAQDTGGGRGGDNQGGRGGRGWGGGRGGATSGPAFDPETWKKDMMEKTKKDLGANDDEWKVIEPKLTKVQTLQRQGRGGMGMMGMMGMGGGRGGAAQELPADAPDTQKKMAELQKVLKNTEAKPEDIKAALAAYREAKAKAKAELEAAQKDLKDVLTARQEAVCVSQGILE